MTLSLVKLSQFWVSEEYMLSTGEYVVDWGYNGPEAEYDVRCLSTEHEDLGKVLEIAINADWAVVATADHELMFIVAESLHAFMISNAFPYHAPLQRPVGVLEYDRRYRYKLLSVTVEDQQIKTSVRLGDAVALALQHVHDDVTVSAFHDEQLVLRLDGS